jgi:chemotaxis protein MotB
MEGWTEMNPATPNSRAVAVRRRVLLAATTALLAGAGVGCVPQQRYDELMTAYRGQEQTLLSTRSELETARENERLLRDQLVSSSDELRRLERFRDGASGEIDRMLADYDRLQRQLVELGAGPLPQEIAAAIADLAARYPDVLEFDAGRGLVRFAADFTVPLGSTDLSESARQAIRTFAGILNSAPASNLEIRIVGHTDNVPIGRPDTRAKHPTNLHLSAHRAISVRDALVNASVAPARFSVMAYGEFRPLVPNTRRGAPQNRRVEIFLAPLLVPSEEGGVGIGEETIVVVPEEPSK